MPTLKNPLLVGTVAVDVLKKRSDGNEIEEISLQLGGVCKRVACLIGESGLAPIFVSATFAGELASSVKITLADHGVSWRPIREQAGLAHYEAILDPNGQIEYELFTDNGSLAVLTPMQLVDHLREIDEVSAIVSCTDLDVQSIAALGRTASERKVHFWIVCSGTEDAAKLMAVPAPCVIALNTTELEAVYGCHLHSEAEVCAAAKRLSRGTTVVSVTMGGAGAILYHPVERKAFLQRVPSVSAESTVGAGDVLVGGLFVARQAGIRWEQSIRIATTLAVCHVTGQGIPLLDHAAFISGELLPPIEQLPC